jgi:hypothetical protein
MNWAVAARPTLCRKKILDLPHYSSDDGFRPKRLMARQMILTHPIAILAMIAMVHLCFFTRDGPFSSNGAAARAGDMGRMITHPPI